MMEKDSPVRPPDETGTATTENLRQEPERDTLPEKPVDAGICFGAGGLTLEQVIDMTGEFVHLHELVMLHITKAGGFSDTGAYFKTVQPILDLLEMEIRVRCRPEMTQQQVKLIVQDWIDQEIRECGGPAVPMPEKGNKSEQNDTCICNPDHSH